MASVRDMAVSMSLATCLRTKRSPCSRNRVLRPSTR